MTFNHDPYSAGYRCAENIYLKVIAKIMKQHRITQVDISDVELASTDAVNVIEEKAGKFYRIQGHFQLEK